MSKRTSAILSTMMKDVQQTVQAASKMDSLLSLGEVLGGIGFGGTVSEPVPLPPPSGDSGGARPDGSEGGFQEAASCVNGDCGYMVEEDGDWLEEAAAAVGGLEGFLNEVIFTSGNVDSSSFGSTTFLIRGEDICSRIESTPMATTCIDSEGNSEVNCQLQREVWEGDSGDDLAQCVALLDSLEISIEATLEGDEGITLELQGHGVTVLILELQPDSVTVKLPLGEIHAAIEEIAGAVGENISDLPTVMEGLLALSLVRNGPLDMTASVAIEESLDVQGQTREGAYTARSGARNPLSSVRINAAAQSVNLLADWNVTELIMPARLIWSQAPGQLHLLLQALSFETELNAAAALQLKGISLGQGPSWLKLDNQSLVEVLLNPAAGHSLDLEVSSWAREMPLITVDPDLELELQLHLGLIEPYLGSEDQSPFWDYDPQPTPERATPIGAWCRDEIYRFSLTSANGLPAVRPVEHSGDFDGGLKVERGALTISSQKSAAQVTVPAGSCLTSKDVEGEARSLVEMLQVSACPVPGAPRGDTSDTTEPLP